MVSVTTTVLKAPTGLSITSGTNSEVLKWTDGTTTNSTVSIERSTDGTNWSVIATVNHGVQTYSNSPVTEGATYYYRIRNYDSAVAPPTYSAYATAAAVTVPPAAPTHVEVVFLPSPTLVATVLWADNSASNTAYEVDRSANGGTTWTALTTTLPASSTSYTDTTVVGGQAYQYRVKSLINSVPSTAVSTLSEIASSLPSPFAHGDIGDAATVGLAGSASYNSATGVYTLTGAGADIWNTADGFQFAYTTLTGDGSFVTQVTSMANFVNFGKAGIMMRNSLDPSSAYAIAFLTSQGTINFEERPSAGASSAGRASQGTFSTPTWLKISRSGNSFSVYYGNNGTSWTQLGSSFAITMGSTIDVGLITSAHSSSQLATATFANVAVNRPPTVAVPAAANPSPVTGTLTTLSVLGSDQTAGEAALTYTWATTGTPPAAVAFSANGTNAAKNTLATFTAPGTYNFQVTIVNPAAGSMFATTSSVSVTVNQTVTSIVVSPAVVSLNESGVQQFAATAKDQFGATLPSQPTLSWSASGGTISSSGLYTAPFASGSFQITAASGLTSGSATAGITLLTGDIDGDGQRTSADITALLTALTDLNVYQSSHSLSQNDLIAVCDLNRDGAVTNADIQTMLDLIISISGSSSASASAALVRSSDGDPADVTGSCELPLFSIDAVNQAPQTDFGQALEKAANRTTAGLRVLNGPTRSIAGALHHLLQFAPKDLTTIVPITFDQLVGSNSEGEHLRFRVALFQPHADKMIRRVSYPGPLETAYGFSVPRVANRNRPHDILADEVFSQWPSLASTRLRTQMRI
jgi:hypothetical protein